MLDYEELVQKKMIVKHLINNFWVACKLKKLLELLG